MSEHPEHQVVHLDADQLKALAHPVRMRLLAALRLDGPSTATALAQRLGTNSGKTSYHLRQLADVGLVTEDSDRGTARDRWWKAAHDGTSWSYGDFLDDPDSTVAADWLTGHVARLHGRWASEFVEARSDWSPEWLSASTLSDYRLHLTPDELRELNDELHGVIERYRDRTPASGAEQVMVILHAFPNPDPSL